MSGARPCRVRDFAMVLALGACVLLIRTIPMIRGIADDGKNILRFVLLFATVVQTGISIYYLSQAGAATTLFKHRQAGFWLTGAIVMSYAAYALIVLAYLIQSGWTVWSSVVLPIWTWWLGAIVLLIGGVVVVRGFRDLGGNLTISPSTKEGHQLVTTSSYGWVRHPLYSGVFVEIVLLQNASCVPTVVARTRFMAKSSLRHVQLAELTIATWPAGTLIFYSASFAATWGVYQATGAPTPWGTSLAMIGFALLA